jgi:hypothetical protein
LKASNSDAHRHRVGAELRGAPSLRLAEHLDRRRAQLLHDRAARLARQHIPTQSTYSTSGSPLTVVGTSGSIAERFGVLTASAFTLPPSPAPAPLIGQK